MKRLTKPTAWAGVLLTVLLLVQPSSALPPIGDCGYGPCCGIEPVDSGICRTQNWKPNQGKCKETYYSWTQYHNSCVAVPDFFTFVVVFSYKYPSTEYACPHQNDCPDEQDDGE